MPDKGTLQDHLDDVRAELKRTQDVLHTLHGTAASLAGTVEDYKAANTELRYQLELAREEANQAYKRADRYRAQLAELGDRLAASWKIQGDLMRRLEEAGLE